MRSTTANVVNFGADTTGTKDSWAAIMAAFNAVATGPDTNRGTIFFPPGTYLVSRSIDFSGANLNACFLGVLGASTVTGNFADYVFKRALADTSGWSGCHSVENLTVVNTNATGGGIRIGACVGASVRNCVITANQGLNTASDDAIAGVTSLEVIIENCTLSPGANASGSNGIMSVADGPILNCTMTGFDVGMCLWGQQAGMSVIGCRFELCGIGLAPGRKPDGSLFGASSVSVSGCQFKNCGTAILGGGGSAYFTGIRVEGAEGTIAGNPQFGIKLPANNQGNGTFKGIIVTGQFQQYGVYLEGGEAFVQRATLIGVQSTNTSTLGGLAWRLPPTANAAQFIGCNVAPVFTMAGLPAFPLPITSISWSAGTTTVVVGGGNIGPYVSSTVAITTQGITPSGYNGLFTTGVTWAITSASWSGTPGGSGTATVIVTGLTVNGSVALTVAGVTPGGFNGFFSAATANSGTNTITYTVNDPGSPTGTGGNVKGGVISSNTLIYSQSNPGSPTGTGGTVILNPASTAGPNVLEGDVYNVSDASSATWGANPVGGGTTHAKVRWNGTSANWAVMGK